MRYDLKHLCDLRRGGGRTELPPRGRTPGDGAAGGQPHRAGTGGPARRQAPGANDPKGAADGIRAVICSKRRRKFSAASNRGEHGPPACLGHQGDPARRLHNDHRPFAGAGHYARIPPRQSGRPPRTDLHDVPVQRDRILQDEIDLGFIEGPFQSSEIETRPVARHRLVALLPPGHPLAAKETLTIEDLAA